MKILKTTPQLILLFIATLIASCTYEPVDGSVEPDPDSGLFQADFNGKTWKSTENEAIVSGNFIEISAINSKGESFGIMIDGSTTGTYAANMNIVAYSPADIEYGYWSINEDNPDEETGSVIITSINKETKTISGTFQFKGYWSDLENLQLPPIMFTNGVFKDIPYITLEETADIFTAKVGGVNFVPTDIQAMEVGVDSNYFITIGAQDANSNIISIDIKTTLDIGSHTIINTVGADVQGNYEDADGEHKAVSGNITITSKTSDRIKGTFEFRTNGATPFIITEGNFDVEY